MKFGTEVHGGDAPAPVDFRTDSTTVAPPVGRFSFRQAIPCPSIISKTARCITMKFDTEIYGGNAPAPVDFRTDSTTVAPPVGRFSFRLLRSFLVRRLSQKPLDGS